MAKDTKERILSTALEMFSQNGYAGMNIRELTASLGLVKSSMYKHFASKEEIWNTLLDELIAYYHERFGSPVHLPPIPDSLEGLVMMTMNMVNFTVYDEKVVMTRKLLTIEQFRDDRARALATKHFLTGLKEMFTGMTSTSSPSFVTSLCRLPGWNPTTFREEPVFWAVVLWRNGNLTCWQLAGIPLSEGLLRSRLLSPTFAPVAA